MSPDLSHPNHSIISHIPKTHLPNLSQVPMTSCFSCRFQDLYVEVLFIVEGGQGRVTSPGCLVGGLGVTSPQPPSTHSLTIEELVRVGGIGNVPRGPVWGKECQLGWGREVG